MRGLINYGTNCSLNSIVQCLYATPGLHNLLRNGRQGHLSYGSVALTLKCLLDDMALESQRPCDPNPLVNALNEHQGFQLFCVQEDADTVFRCILEALTNGPVKAIRGMWDFETEKCIRCTACHTTKVKREKSVTILVHLSNQHVNNLQGYLESYSQQKDIASAYNCDTCHAKAKAEITSKVLILPTNVCVVIQRVRNMGRNSACIVKTEELFTFPETLDLKCLAKESTEGAEHLYGLYGVVAHRGTHYDGHNTAYVWNNESSWYLADDTQLMACSWEDVQRTYVGGSALYHEVAYMLMYSALASGACYSV
ncbi:ubl carboxyl-terminal hydrolase 18-like [Melanotaenia boesemani]|uniref:ubl carboxyl-terminal hydrolase 18-like n=1 Tax=Melanotaenia boesemani TaxID=1250792 RepID=UPI001C0517FF|nr:ubl carboxyl-terminal hydrolase 18-like [Melanotaenia boesemani]